MGQITLVPGKPPSGSVDTSSSVRVRAGDKKNYRLSDEEIALVLQVSPEPKMHWQHVRSLTIDKAIDDNNQKLTESAGGAGGPGGGAAGAGAGGIVVMPGGGWGNVWLAGGNGLTHNVNVRLKKGEKESKSLKELTGTITGQFRGDAEPVIVADSVMKAGGKSFKGKPSGEIKVLTAEKKDDGTIQIAFEFELPTDVTAETTINVPGAARLPPAKVPAPPAAVPPAGGGVPAIRLPPPMPMQRYAFNGLTLRDDKDNILNASIVPNWKKAAFIGGGRKLEYLATYRPAGKDAPEPAKLVFTGRRLMTVSVPFTLKDVELK
jgi:hypothetical protein